MINNNQATPYFDLGALTLWLGAFANILPSIAAGLSIIWLCIRIYESNTVREWRGKPPYTHGD